MSHFTTLVLFNQFPTGNIEEDVATMIAPYDENVRVSEYEADCHCIGRIAHNEARRFAEQTLKVTIDELRKAFWAIRPENETEEEQDAAWKKHVAEFVQLEETTFANHPMKDKPDPECGFYSGEFWEAQARDGKIDASQLGQRFKDGSGCGGTGKYKTTYNPKSKWDWWRIGGRWQGALDPDYDIESDERNWETCWLCKGTGLRNDQLGLDARKKDPTYTCNGCQGTGKMLKYDLAPHTKGNVKMVSEINGFIPFAIVTPNGEWHEKGDMGWWGIVNDEKDDWKETARDILNKHKECIAVLCDLHI